MYVTVPNELPVLVGLSTIVDVPLAVTLAGFTVPEIELVQVNVVPATVNAGVKLSGPAPLHLIAVNGLVVTTLAGSTVTTTTIGVPLHPFDAGVMV